MGAGYRANAPQKMPRVNELATAWVRGAIVGFLLGLFFGSRASGRPQPQETAASRALRPWMVAISVIGGLFVLPQVDKAWPGSAFGRLSIACAFIAGYLITNMIQTRRYRLESAKRLRRQLRPRT
jgi:hypothetical protein